MSAAPFGRWFGFGAFQRAACTVYAAFVCMPGAPRHRGLRMRGVITITARSLDHAVGRPDQDRPWFMSTCVAAQPAMNVARSFTPPVMVLREPGPYHFGCLRVLSVAIRMLHTASIPMNVVPARTGRTKPCPAVAVPIG